MTDINKQRFLAELAKLLTFMYEEDRQTALAMYERMFEKTGDEMALIQLLGSPTKQAVIVARAYSARERKLQVQSQSRESGGQAEPNPSADYIQAINQIQASAVAQRIIPPEVTAGQLTLFEDDDREHTETWPIGEEPQAPAPSGEEPAVVPPTPAPAPAPVGEPQPAPQEPAQEAAPAGEEPAPQPEPVEPQQAQQPQQPDEVDEFLAHFSVGGAEPKAPEEVPAKPEPPILELADEEEAAPAPAGTVRKPRVFLLILYVLFAVPVTVVGTLLLLLPTLLFLILAAVIIAAGVAILIAAFSGFAVFADIMVVLGTALVTLALGLLFLWIFIWFIGGAIVGLVRGVIELGGSWCFKEVPAK